MSYTDQRKLICKIMALNEALYGQQEDRLQNLLRQTNIRLDINFDRYFLCLTGLNKRFYTKRLAMDREAYASFLLDLKQIIRRHFKKQNIPVEITAVQYNHSKQVCVILNPDKEDFDTAAAAHFIHTAAESFYQKNPLYKQSGLHNLTVFSPLLRSYKELAPAYQNLVSLNELSFFIMSSQILSEDEKQKKQVPLPLNQVFDLLSRLEETILRGDIPGLKTCVEELFLVRLTKSLDLPLLQDTVSNIKRKLSRYNQIFDLALDEEIQDLRAENYPTVREFTSALEVLLEECAGATSQFGKNLGALSLKAIHYIKTNYTQNIGLSEVAGYVNAAPGYLSRVFNKETGKSIPAYINQTRMNHAASLLENSREKIVEIGKTVGIENPQYFSALFKKHTGSRPQDYRLSRGLPAVREEET